MKKLALALGIVALCFAGTTAYYARELHLERERHVVAASSQGPREPPAVAREPARTRTDAVATTPPAATAGKTKAADEVSPEFPMAVARGREPTEEQMREQIRQMREFLAQVSDPAGRAKLLEQHKAMQRTWQRGLAEYLKMSPEEFTRFQDMLAQQELTMRETATRCFLDKQCKLSRSNNNLVEAQMRDIASNFGSETVELYQEYQRSHSERRAVQELRGRLPDSARLSDDKARQLVRALADESEIIRKDMARVGHGIGMHNNAAYVAMDADPDGKKAAAADEYNRRLRDRAAGILTPEQMAVYTQMQDEDLEQSRAFASMRQGNR